MHAFLITLALVGQSEPSAAASKVDSLRDYYGSVAREYAFHRDVARTLPLDFRAQPIMRWANDDDWSGDVFVWTHAGRPAVIGCILSGPGGAAKRLVYHEFHQVATEPIAPVDLMTKRRWMPQSGLPVQALVGAPKPASTPTARLTQMRRIAKEFTTHMEASGVWELRLLPQPLYRWDKAGEESADGALFGYVWPKGTDLEVILLLESLPTADGRRWHFAPVRFSNRSVWLKYEGNEVWRAASHREPQDKTTDLLYTTAYATTISHPADAGLPSPPEKP